MSNNIESESEQNTSELPIVEEQKYNTLFAISSRDIDCSILLYSNEQYPHSVFYLQQSVEKAVKSMGLLYGLITEKDLMRNIGHDSLKVYKKPVNKFTENIISLDKSLRSNPVVILIMNLSGIDFDNFVSDVKKGKHEFNQYVSNISKYNFSAEELQEYITKMENLNKSIEKDNKRMNEEGINDKKFEVMKGELKASFESALMSLKIPDIIKELLGNVLLSIFDSFFPKKEFFEQNGYFLINFMGIIMNLFYLSVITSLHSSKARYPEENFNPLTFYTPECPLIEKMPQIQNLTKYSLNEMAKLSDFVINPPDHLLNYPNVFSEL